MIGVGGDGVSGDMVRHVLWLCRLMMLVVLPLCSVFVMPYCVVHAFYVAVDGVDVVS